MDRAGSGNPRERHRIRRAPRPREGARRAIRRSGLEGAAASRASRAAARAAVGLVVILVERATALLGEVGAAAFAQIFVRAAALRADEAFAGRTLAGRARVSNPSSWSVVSVSLLWSLDWACPLELWPPKSAPWLSVVPEPVLLSLPPIGWPPGAVAPAGGPPSRFGSRCSGLRSFLRNPGCRRRLGTGAAGLLALLPSFALLGLLSSSAAFVIIDLVVTIVGHTNAPSHRPRLLRAVQQGTKPNRSDRPNELCDEPPGARKRPPPGWATAS